MAAFNWIEMTTRCPVCSETTLVRAQLHIAASFDGDEVGRFCDVSYSVGDKMRWWQGDHPHFHDWMLIGEQTDTNTVRECCYACCSAAGDRLYLIVEVSDLLIRQIVEVGSEDAWPAKFLK
jgi:hypothetical protein